MRSFDNMKGCQTVANGEQVYQNFIRPHSGLDGQTPAQKAGIELDLKGNKWKALIQRATTANPPKVNRGKIDGWLPR